MKKENMKIGRSIDFERETRVLLEAMQSGINVIAEGHTGIISRLDRVEARLGGVESELHTVKMVVFDLDSRLTKVESKLDVSIGQNEERFRQIEKKLALA
ncbi:MAG: hypothetical protein NTW09_04400 [Candidatus Omnitrophica bacterium]|nr:hypothetical protein [Candidatus Omnitrophota bacterium]